MIFPDQYCHLCYRQNFKSLESGASLKLDLSEEIKGMEIAVRNNAKNNVELYSIEIKLKD